MSPSEQAREGIVCVEVPENHPPQVHGFDIYSFSGQKVTVNGGVSRFCFEHEVEALWDWVKRAQDETALLRESLAKAERELTAAHDHIIHADAYQKAAMDNLDRALKAESQVAEAKAALAELLADYTNPYQKKRGGDERARVFGMIERCEATLASLEPKETDDGA